MDSRLASLLRQDWMLFSAAVALVVLGAAATSTNSGQPEIISARHPVWAAICLGAMVLGATIHHRWLAWVSPIALTGCMLLLLWVLREPPVNGARRWIFVGPMSLQPSEIAKVVYVLVVARVIGFASESRQQVGLSEALQIVAFTLMLVVPIVFQPDLGTGLVFLPTGFVLLACSAVPRRYLVCVAALGIIAVPVVWNVMSPRQRDRISGFLDQKDLGPKPLANGYQLYQSKRIIALAGIWGHEDARREHLPYGYTDFVFTVIARRWGLAGASTVLALFAVFTWRGLQIADRSPDPLGHSLAVGLVTLLVGQALMNMGMVVGLAPIAGLPLPFVSYGGSSLLATGFAAGVLLNISSETKRWATY